MKKKKKKLTDIDKTKRELDINIGDIEEKKNIKKERIQNIPPTKENLWNDDSLLFNIVGSEYEKQGKTEYIQESLNILQKKPT